MRFIAAFVISCAIIAAGLVVFAYSGFYDVAASTEHGGLVHWYAGTVSRHSIERRARHVQVPVIAGENRIVQGAGEYDEECAGCHGAPGQEPRAVGKGLQPDPPDLKRAADVMSAAALFWVTKHGIAMTGMPAWGVHHDDDMLWSIVAFINEMPQMTPSRYQQLVSEARAAESEVEPGASPAPAPPSSPPAPPGT